MGKAIDIDNVQKGGECHYPQKLETSFLELITTDEKLELVVASESSLKKDWLLPEEDEAWQDL